MISEKGSSRLIPYIHNRKGMGVDPLKTEEKKKREAKAKPVAAIATERQDRSHE